MSPVACTYCRQVVGHYPGVRLSSPGRRLGQYALDGALALVTLGIGWLIWSIVVWGRGQTPAMKIIGMYVLKVPTGQAASRGAMALRELVGKGLMMGAISLVPIAWIVLQFMLLWDRDRQQLWDKIASTIVVDEVPMYTGAA